MGPTARSLLWRVVCRPSLSEPPAREGGSFMVLANPSRPTHLHKSCPQGKIKCVKGTGNLTTILGTQTFCWLLTPSPPWEDGVFAH